ncbi:MAG: NYN domain-containing protein [Candidatus Absconditabacteria bacterium]|nr:NYN domain-containing protein [Candidatus Absconditabacteria bacterium]
MFIKETLILPDGTTKGNVDIDIAIIGLRDVYEKSISKAYIVTGDGDYNSLIDFWIEKQIFGKAILPGIRNSSKLLTKSAKKQILDIIPLQKKLQKENPGNKS